MVKEEYYVMHQGRSTKQGLLSDFTDEEIKRCFATKTKPSVGVTAQTKSASATSEKSNEKVQDAGGTTTQTTHQSHSVTSQAPVKATESPDPYEEWLEGLMPCGKSRREFIWDSCLDLDFLLSWAFHSGRTSHYTQDRDYEV